MVGSDHHPVSLQACLAVPSEPPHGAAIEEEEDDEGEEKWEEAGDDDQEEAAGGAGAEEVKVKIRILVLSVSWADDGPTPAASSSNNPWEGECRIAHTHLPASSPWVADNTHTSPRTWYVTRSSVFVACLGPS